MVVYGADTAQLTRLASRYESCAREMVEHSGRLSTVVASVRWEGHDADAFRASWSSLEQRIRARHDELQRQGQELQQHAEEQDRASANDAARPLHSLFSSLAHAFGSLVGDVLGTGSGGGLRLPLSAAASSAMTGFQAAAPAAGGAPAADEAPAVPEDHAYASPQGDQTHSVGEDNGETAVTAKDAEGNKVTATVGDDGSVSLEAKDSLLKTEMTLPDGTKITTETAESYTVTENADGTVTYTFEQSHSLKGEGEAGPVSGEAEGVGSTTLQVTLPEGSTAADALAVNPHDPDTIPPGGSVTAEVSATASGEVGVSGTKGVWEYLTVGGGAEGEVGHTAVYSKDEDGTLSIASGPKEAFASSIFAQIGTDDWHLRFENGTGTTTTQLEYAEFSADEAGADAYRDAASGGGMPDRIDGAVTDRYTENRTLSVGESSASAQLGSVGAERSSTDFAIERIEREWPDGHEEFVEYAAPRLNESGTFAETVGGTGRETSYRVSLQDEGPAFMTNDRSFGDAYGGREAMNNGVDMYYSAAELEQMRAGAEHRTGITFESNEAYLQYLAGTSAFSPTGGAPEALWTGYNDYNGGDYQLNDPNTGGEYPGRQESPGR
jgi:uncharacterized protein YukE